MDDQQERDLVRSLREGSANAWGALHDAFAESLWRAVARLMGPGAADVADVVQETFLAAARSARTFDPARGTLWLWLWGIGRRQVALHFRKQQRHDRLRLPHRSPASPGGHADAPGAALEAAEQANLVRIALAELPDNYEDLLTAKYLDGLSVEQLARRHGCTEVALRSKLARAREAFRAAFAKTNVNV